MKKMVRKTPELILNQRNELLSGLHAEMLPHCSGIVAAVAYVEWIPEFFASIEQKRTSLTLIARWGDGLPVSTEVIKWFEKRNHKQSQLWLNCEKFHPKVIWWRGQGVYIGSANLTQNGWFKNCEAGVFFHEKDIGEEELKELGRFFKLLLKQSHRAPKNLSDTLDRLGLGDLLDFQREIEGELREKLRQVFPKQLPQKKKAKPRARTAAETPDVENTLLDTWANQNEFLKRIDQHLRAMAPQINREEIPLGLLVDHFVFWLMKPDQEDLRMELESQDGKLSEFLIEFACQKWVEQNGSISSESPEFQCGREANRLLQEADVLKWTKATWVKLYYQLHVWRFLEKRMDPAHPAKLWEAKSPTERTVKYFASLLWNSDPQSDKFDRSLLSQVYRFSDGQMDKIPGVGEITLREMLGWTHWNRFVPFTSKTKSAIEILGFSHPN